jgi:hypothetical protein
MPNGIPPRPLRNSLASALAMSQECPEDEELPKSLWAALGMPEPVFRDEAQAPTVDNELLVKLVRGELPERSARAVYRLVHSFKSWTNAHAQVVIAEYRRDQGLDS